MIAYLYVQRTLIALLAAYWFSLWKLGLVWYQPISATSGCSWFSLQSVAGSRLESGQKFQFFEYFSSLFELYSTLSMEQFWHFWSQILHRAARVRSRFLWRIIQSLKFTWSGTENEVATFFLRKGFGLGWTREMVKLSSSSFSPRSKLE